MNNVYKTKMILAACALSFLVSCDENRNKPQQGATAYRMDTITLSDRTLRAGYTATIRGYQTVEIRPQVSGQITDIRMKEGDAVRKDSVLFIIDQVPYKAAHDIAVANVRSAEAVLSTARLVLESNKGLLEEEVVSEFDLQTARNEVLEAEAKLALAEAEEKSARNNLSYTEVKSPVNGVASMIPYRVGALVSSTSEEPLVTVSDDSRVYIYFSMAEKQMLDMIQRYGSLKHAIEQLPEVELKMSNGELYAHKGRIDAISGTIDERTGAVSLRAVFPNKERLLRNGGSGTVLIPAIRKDCIVIPQTATYELQDRIFVYKVVDGKAVSTRIEVFPQNDGKEYIVESGLQEGDVIIAEGAGLVREGTVVESENTRRE